MTNADTPPEESLRAGLKWLRPHWGKIAKTFAMALLAILGFLGKEAWWAYTTIKEQQAKIAQQQETLTSLGRQQQKIASQQDDQKDLLDSWKKWAACADKKLNVKDRNYVLIWPTLECQETARVNEGELRATPDP